MASGSSALNTADPATNVSAPASTQRSMVLSEMPPSTWSQMSPPCASSSARVRRIFGSITSRNDCPPKPGSTVISSTMSSSGSRSAYGSIGVAGRSPMDAREPSRRSSRASRTGASDASTWKVTDSAPASA